MTVDWLWFLPKVSPSASSRLQLLLANPSAEGGTCG